MKAKLWGTNAGKPSASASVPAAEFEAATEGDDPATVTALAEMSSVVAVGAGPEHREHCRRLSDWPHVSSRFTTSTVQSS